MPTAGLDDLIAYLDGSPSPFHAVESTVARLGDSTQLDEREPWATLPDRGHVIRDGALIAWALPPDARPTSGFRIAGAHTDSPGLHVKPNPDAGGFGWKQLAVEVYGGILNNTWLDRDLGIAGRVVDADGGHHLVHVDRPVARVPQLAVHLDREVNSGGLKLDTQQHLSPVWGVGSGRAGEFADWLAGEAGLDRPPAWWNLCLVDTLGAAVIGADRSLLASARLDNQLSCWAATTALAEAAPSDHIALIVLNDHEEVGSGSATGAQGPFLEHVLQRIVLALGGSDDDRHRAVAASACVSADNAHAVHPNYPERHEPGHRPIVNAGPAIKVNSNQRYATSDDTAAM
ncbi:MAG: M18 family aminopeptidase, partial [Actinomycetota bacterium]